jgi:hypothetical protein
MSSYVKRDVISYLGIEAAIWSLLLNLKGPCSGLYFNECKLFLNDPVSSSRMVSLLFIFIILNSTHEYCTSLSSDIYPVFVLVLCMVILV